MKLRGCLLLIVSFVALIASCSGALLMYVGINTADSAEYAEAFIDRLESGHLDVAYDSTIPAFKQEQSLYDFVDLIDTMAEPIRAELHPWRDRTVASRNLVKYRGVLVDGYGAEIDFDLTLVKQDGTWNVASFTGPWRQTAGAGAWFKVVPRTDYLERIVNDVTLAFIDAVRIDDLGSFYTSGMSELFRLETGLEQFKSTYAHWVDNNMDVVGLENLSPEFDDDLYANIWGSAPSPAQFCEKGNFNELTFDWEGCKREKIKSWMYNDELVVSGYYPSDPPIGFRYMYRYVHPEYELYRISFADPGIEGLTYHQCLRWLLINAKNKDLSQCYDIDQENTELNPWE